MAEKTCPHCGKTKPLDGFHKNRSTLDGHQAWCKPCMNTDTNDRNKRLWRTDPVFRERVRATNRKHSSASEVAKANRRKAVAKYKRDNRDKVRAGEQVLYAIKLGLLVRATNCEACGKDSEPFSNGVSDIQAHHDDYSKPLDVEWLCILCHNKRHGVLYA